MNVPHEYRTTVRILQTLKAVVDRPNHHTTKTLAARQGVSPDTIRRYVEAIETAGFFITKNEQSCYYLEPDRSHSELKELLYFTERERLILMEVIEQAVTGDKTKARLKQKLTSLYDYSRIGHPILHRPYLDKVNLLRKAKREKRRVILKDYRSSNSNEIRDRHVEPFHPSMQDDMLQAFDVEADPRRPLRHFRISRITHLELIDIPWQHENRHYVQATDPFRIVNNDQVMVHLRLRVGAYNELVERFPLTKNYIHSDATDKNIFDFRSKVNIEFYGLSNFILGQHHRLVEIIEPLTLIEHLQNEVKKMESLFQ